jgi:ankyrin repeat protein
LIPYSSPNFGSLQALLDLVLQKGPTVDCRDYRGDTPLLVAVTMGNQNAIELLLDAGADINVKNQFGQTALSIATEDEDDEMVQFLRAHSANSSELQQEQIKI